MSLRFKGANLRPVLTEAIASQCRLILVKDQGVYFLAELGGDDFAEYFDPKDSVFIRILHTADDLVLSANATHLSLEAVPPA
ncbi:DUF3085 domain-containing protein [Xanthomonas cerealis pv. cerealis]|uniref:DUF3085 domain-containing protein n=1 Tax=Xanthomonas cerealis pv. cerealis TaxID=152263 RepID=A0A514ECS9_9XANT|nr:DUF3085 domain-containing protein [Xanthomonas translucens]QDI03785.1 DUF3085 domain-containing protein [Xanthomonas translucens pv. cerealis]